MISLKNGGFGLICTLLLVGCAQQSRESAHADDVVGLPIDIELDEQTIAAWQYRNAIDADLDGDGQDERVVIVAGVETLEQGTPLWEDGHQWAVFVESPDDTRTLVYTAFVPHGRVFAGVTEPSDEGRKVIVVERSPYRLRTVAIDYVAPGAAVVASVASHAIDSWLPE